MGGSIIAGVGLVLDLFGIGVAMSGLHELSKELFLHPQLPYQRLVIWFRRIFGREPSPRVHQASVAATIKSAGQLRAQGVRGKPSEDEPLTEWNLYWESRINNLNQKLEWINNDMRKADEELSKRLAEETQARLKSDAASKQRQEELLAGEGGKGLVRTSWGLPATLFGTLLQGVAGIFG